MKVRIILMALLASLSVLAAEARSFKAAGVVTDSEGTPLVGAGVVEKGTKNGVLTDLNGRFVISVNDGAELEVSYIGFSTQVLKADMSMHVTLEEDAVMIDEVVVVGYGVQTKENLTGAVSQVKGSDIALKVAPNVTSMLQGEAAGVVVSQSSGQPGEEGMSLQIRGHSSVNSIKTLVLIDGIEGDLDMLNPNDIESISVLKDASSASIYGSKAAAGVILVTTRQGQAERVKIEYAGSASLTFRGCTPSRLNSWEEYEITQIANDKPVNVEFVELMKNPNLNSILASTTSINYYDNVDWVDVCLNDVSYMTRHSLSARGGTKKLNYSASMGYYTRDGFFRSGLDDNSRYNFRLNVNSRINRFVDLDFNVSANRSEVNSTAFSVGAMLASIYRSRTRMSVYFPHDEDPLPNPNVYAGQDGVNPIDMMQNGGATEDVRNDISGKVNLRIRNLVPGLRFDFSASRNYSSRQNDRNTNQIKWYGRGDYIYRYSQTNPSSVSKSRTNISTDKLNAIVRYAKDVKRYHSFLIMAGSEWENYRYDAVSTSKEYMPKGVFSLNFGNTASAKSSDDVRTSAIMSFFGRFNYDYRDKYLFEANLRCDGSSRLAPQNRWGFFPSVSAGWVLSKEDWIRDRADWLSLLKIRGSFGRLGNADALGYYDYISLVTTGNTVLGGSQVTTAYVPQLASTTKTWEIVEVSNVGLDAAFFKNRLQMEGEYYLKRNINMLSSALGVPSLVGTGLPSINVGELNTWGWEIDVQWKDSIGKSLMYWVGFNLSDNSNRLVRYDGSNVIKEGIVRLLEGYPLNTIWGYRTDGLFQENPSADVAICQPGGALTSAGDVRYVNLDDDPYITGGDYTPDSPGDLVLLGNTDPRYTYGIELGLTYKGLSLGVRFNGVGKRNILLDETTLNPTQGSLYQAIDIHRDYWTSNNTDAFMPRPVYKGGSYNYRAADRWIQDASYIRLKNITLGYDVPLKNRKVVNRIYVYLSGDNLWEYSNLRWKVFDPEAPALTSVNSWYAFYRAASLGVNLSF